MNFTSLMLIQLILINLNFALLTLQRNEIEIVSKCKVNYMHNTPRIFYLLLRKEEQSASLMCIKPLDQAFYSGAIHLSRKHFSVRTFFLTMCRCIFHTCALEAARTLINIPLFIVALFRVLCERSYFHFYSLIF